MGCFGCKLENVLCGVAREYQFLQNPFVGGVQLEYRPGLVRFLFQFDELALHLHVLTLVVGCLEHHYVLFPFHGVAHDVFTGR